MVRMEIIPPWLNTVLKITLPSFKNSKKSNLFHDLMHFFRLFGQTKTIFDKLDLVSLFSAGFEDSSNKKKSRK